VWQAARAASPVWPRLATCQGWRAAETIAES
jgi:hypothetical protein